MALHFDYKNCAGPSAHPANPDKMHPVLHSIIWSTMEVDIGQIKDEKDAAEYAFRLGLYQRLTGPLLAWGGDSSVKAYITLDDVKQYIGLRCNVSNTKRVSWMARFAKMAEDHPLKNAQVDFGGGAGKDDKPMSAIGIVQWLTDHRWGATIYTSGDDEDVGFTVRKTPDGTAVVKKRERDVSISFDGDEAKALLKEVTGAAPGTKDEYIADFCSTAKQAA